MMFNSFELSISMVMVMIMVMIIDADAVANDAVFADGNVLMFQSITSIMIDSTN